MRWFRKFLYSVCMPVCVFIGYFGLSFLLARYMQNLPFVVKNGAADVFVCVLFGILYYFVYVRSASKSDFTKFSGFGRFVVVCMFIMLFLFSQLMAFWVAKHYPSEYMKTYSDLSGNDLIMYVAMAITIAPITEELIFRGFLYRVVRRNYSVLTGLIFSSVLFALAHGTTEHIPVTLGLTMFNCLLLEITGKLWYCIVAHVLYNLCGAAYIMSVPISGNAVIAGYAVFIFLLIAGFFERYKLREKLQIGGMRSVQSILDEKRKAILRQNDDED